jgi:hypothetical protein
MFLVILQSSIIVRLDAYLLKIRCCISVTVPFCHIKLAKEDPMLEQSLKNPHEHNTIRQANRMQLIDRNVQCGGK